MRRGVRQDQGGWIGRVFSSVVVLALVAGGVAAWRLDLVVPWYDHFAHRQHAPSGPSQVAPPPSVDLPPLTPPPAVDAALTTATAGVDPAKVRAALAPYLASPLLGRHVVAAVADLAGGKPVVTIGQGAATPASTTKLLTTTAALAALGPEKEFTTKVVTGGAGRIVLVGGGDPLLASKPADPDDQDGPTYPERADVTTLAAKTAAKLHKQGRTQVQLGYDDSLFTGPSVDPAWPADYIPDGVVAPVTALWVDEGRPAEGSGRVSDPSLYAAQTFAAALTADGITVSGTPTRGQAGSGGRTLAAVHSAPLREIVEHTLLVSDNEAAEVLGHQVGLAVNGDGSFAGGVTAVLATLQQLGVSTSGIDIHDGSGLSRRNRITPAALVAVLRAGLDPAHPALHTILDSLPVAGFTGSLTDRFDQVFPQARGLVRAKTGTLTNVSSLAGIAVDQAGHAMLFVLMADHVAKINETKAQNTLDQAAGALGACGC